MRPWSLALVCLLLGCGSGGPPRPTLYPVKGTVTQGGKPVKGIAVSVYPAGGETATGTPAGGTTGEDGSFLLTSPTGTGVAVGSYKVVLMSPVDISSYSGSTRGGPPKPLIDIPKKLTSFKSTDKLVDVKANAENVIKIDF